MLDNQGLLCPDCMQVFSDVTLLSNHFEQFHSDKGGKEKIVGESEIETKPSVNANNSDKTHGNHDKKLKASPKQNESKNKPKNKLAASLGDFINNFTLKPSTNTDNSIRSESIPDGGSFEKHQSANVNTNKVDRTTRLKQQCIYLNDRNKLLTDMISNFCNIKGGIEDYQSIVEKCKDLLSTPVKETIPKIDGNQDTKNDEETVESNTYAKEMELRNIISEMETKITNQSTSLENIGRIHKDDIDKLRCEYNDTIERLVKQSAEKNEATGDEMSVENLKLIKELHSLKENLSVKESEFMELLKHGEHLEKALKEKETTIENHNQTVDKYKLKFERLVEKEVKSRNEQKRLESEIVTLNEYITGIEANNKRMMNDNEEITGNLLVKNDQMNSQNKILNTKLSELSKNYGILHEKHKNLVETHKKLVETNEKMGKLVEVLKEKNNELTENQNGLATKLEKEIARNGQFDQQTSQLKEKINQLNELNDSKSDQYNKLVLSHEKECSSYKVEYNKLVDKLKEAEQKTIDQINDYKILKSQHDLIYSQYQSEKSKNEQQTYELNCLNEKLNTHDDYVNGLLDKISILESRDNKLEHDYQESNLALCELDEENRKLKKKLCEIYSRYWKNDEQTSTCSRCDTGFKFTTRKHHCRNCGDIVCEKCGSATITLPCGPHPERVCDNCLDEIMHFRNQL